MTSEKKLAVTFQESTTEINPISSEIGEHARVFTWGRNEHGELGLGPPNKKKKNFPFVNEPRAIPNVPSGINRLCVGDYHSVIIADSVLWFFGANHSGQCGDLEGSSKNQWVPVLADAPNRMIQNQSIIYFATSRTYCVVGLSNGQVLAWGKSHPTGRVRLSPKKINFDLDETKEWLRRLKHNTNRHPRTASLNADRIRIKQLACGEGFTLALSDHGFVYRWGSKRGRNNTITKRSKPHLISFFPKKGMRATYICCGMSHSMVVCSPGRLWTWGNNTFGQLGLGEKHLHKDKDEPMQPQFSFLDMSRRGTTGGISDIRSWRKSSPPKNEIVNIVVRRVAAGAFHSMALADVLIKRNDGSSKMIARRSVYAWGNNRYGQCGIGPPGSRCVPSPALIQPLAPMPTPDTVDDDDDGSLFEGALLSSNDEVVQISCGGMHSACVSMVGRVFIWGQGYYGQLGQGDCENQYSPKPIMYGFDGKNGKRSPIAQVVCGAYHTMAVEGKPRKMRSLVKDTKKGPK